MRNTALPFLSKLTLSLLLPQLAFSSPIIAPHFKNHGQFISHEALSHLFRLNGHVPVDVQYSVQNQAMDKDKVLKLSIVLSLNNEKELDERLLSITNPLRPDYQHYLSQQEFINRYSPTAEQVDDTKTYLENNGMHVESITPNRLIIHASGSITAIEKSFNTRIYYYTDTTGKSFYAPAYELQTNKKLPILGVLGLENRTKPQPYFKRLNNLKTTHATTAIQGMSPDNIKKAYAIPSNVTGAGQTLALYQLDGYTASDITAYEDAFNLPHVPIQNILLDGATGIPTGGTYSGEVTLDIELMIAMAPGVSKILVYEGPFTGAGLVDTFNRIATDNLAKSISSSWGIAESSNTAPIFKSENAIFKQMVAQGQTLFVASGDFGAYADGKTLGVNDPASQPFVVGVGGTKLLTDSNGSYLSETTWAEGASVGSAGGTGGISTFWTIPSWQKPVVTPASKGSTTMRNVPDVSLNSDPNTGYAIFYDKEWIVVGGTSAAAPLWAAFTALVNQERSNNGKEPVGFLNPTFYTLGQSADYPLTFHDIKDGSTNLYYPAIAGYDLATGFGSFIGSALLDYLAGTVTPPPTACVRANPTVSITPSSQKGTPGGKLSYAINVTNNDNSLCNASTFNLTATTPNGFTNALTQNSLTLSPGSLGTSSIQITSQSSSTSGDYPFSVNAINVGESSYKGTASATYAINQPQGQLNLTVDPQFISFPYNSGQYAKFKFIVMNGQKPVPNNLINLTFKGSQFSWSTYLNTTFDGSAQYYIYLNNLVSKGTYQLIATTQYGGNTATTQGSLVIH